MAVYDYGIEAFHGLDQSADEARISPGCSPDECNMDTERGILGVTKGFSRLVQPSVPGTGGVWGAIFRDGDRGVPVAISGGTVYAYSRAASAWQSKYTWEVVPAEPNYCFLQVKIGMQDCLLIADGAHRILKFDGADITLFGSQEGCSDIPCAYLESYRGRLFAAGDAQNPSRLYYSQLPGDGRSIEDWCYYPASPLVEGGHIEIGGEGGDYITGVRAVSNQLVIFKRYSVYRLIGDRPGNFTVERINGCRVNPVNTASAVCGDLLYYLSSEGLCCFNGVEAQKMPDADRIAGLMQSASIKRSRMAAVGSRLYFTLKSGGADLLMEYDVLKRRYLKFGGFALFDIFEHEGGLALIAGARGLSKWGSGSSFDGQSIEAYWRTPRTYLGDITSVKTLRLLSLTGSGEAEIAAEAGGARLVSRVRMTDGVAELPMKNDGRSFSLTIANVNGGALEVSSAAVTASVRKRTQ